MSNRICRPVCLPEILISISSMYSSSSSSSCSAYGIYVFLSICYRSKTCWSYLVAIGSMQVHPFRLNTLCLHIHVLQASRDRVRPYGSQCWCYLPVLPIFTAEHLFIPLLHRAVSNISFLTTVAVTTVEFKRFNLSFMYSERVQFI